MNRYLLHHRSMNLSTIISLRQVIVKNPQSRAQCIYCLFDPAFLAFKSSWFYHVLCIFLFEQLIP